MKNLTENSKIRPSGFTFKKEERLCSKKTIDLVFSSGESIMIYPLKMIFVSVNLPARYPVQVAFAVSKKNFKKAVCRNLIKRRMREAYRLNKHLLSESINQGKQWAIFFIYTGKTTLDYETIEKAMVRGLKKFQLRTSAIKE